MDEKKNEATSIEKAMIPKNKSLDNTSFATRLVEQLGRIFHFPVEFKIETKVSIGKPDNKKNDLETVLRATREGDDK